MKIHPATPFLDGLVSVLLFLFEPFRKLYGVGTPEEPLYFNKDDNVPLWIMVRFQPECLVQFVCEVETFWFEGYQHVYPIHNNASPVVLITVPHKNQTWFWGNPSYYHSHPRPGRPAKKEKKGETSNNLEFA